MAFNGVATYTIKKIHNNNKKVNTADTIDIEVREGNHLTGQQRINRVRTPICIYEYVWEFLYVCGSSSVCRVNIAPLVTFLFV